MTLETMERAGALLVAKGFAATPEYPGTIHIALGRSGKNQKQLLVFGCANETLGADTEHPPDPKRLCVDRSIQSRTLVSLLRRAVKLWGSE